MDPTPAPPDEQPAAPLQPAPGRQPRRHLQAALAAIALVVVLADQASKAWAVRALTDREPMTVIDGWLQFRLTRNPGAAFSLSTGTTWLFTLIAVIVSIVIVRAARRLASRGWTVALGLLLGGAVGNLIDRLFRSPGPARGHVVDFLEYLRFPVMDFPVFNIADSCVVSAAVLIGLLGLRGIGLDGRRGGG
jgi:signal peptidase II